MFGINLELPAYFVFFCILLGFLYAFFLYYVSQNDNISKKIIIILSFFRALFISILAFLLLTPVFKSSSNIIEKPIVIIAKDISESVKEDINKTLQFISESLEDFEVFSYSFSDKIFKGIIEENDGLKTNFANLFSELNNNFENRNVAGIIIASDGSYNAGLNPEYISYDFPVYSIALGDTVERTDISVDNVVNNDIAFLDNTFPLEISLASNIIKDEKSRLRIWNNGVQVYEKIINFSKDINYNTHLLYLTADKVGLQSYIIEVDPLDKELNHINNRFKTYIDVLDSRCNILILKEGSSPDLSAYKSAIEKNLNYKLEIKDIRENIIIDKYQLVVCFGVDNIPDNILNNDIPAIIFNADQSHYIDFKTPVSFKNKGEGQDLHVYKNEDFMGFSFSEELINLITDAPPLFSFFGRYDFQGDMKFVLNQKIGNLESNNPVIMIQQLDSRRIAFITDQGWWRWKLYDYSINNNNLAFDELFLKLSQYLILKEDKSLFRLKYETQYEENDQIIFRAELYNESYELVNNKQVNLVLFDKKDKEYDFQFLKEGNQLVANLGTIEVGSYNFIATVQGTDLVKKGVFDVREIQLEQLGPSINHDILNKMADLSKGKFFYLNDIDSLIRVIRESKNNKNVIYVKEKLDSLINIPWILLILIIFISFEWFIRKYNGLI